MNGKGLLKIALVCLSLALVFGLVSALSYIFPGFLKEHLGFISLRPLHVSSALFWILLGASGSVYLSLEAITGEKPQKRLVGLQIALWLIAIVGIFVSYFSGKFGGREYWEFPPLWSFFILLAWFVFLFNLFPFFRKIRNWPVYVWMWTTGSVFFLFIFIENYIWVLPYFRENFVRDMTIQWKVNGSMVGAWNQLLYGTLFYLMDKISGSRDTGKSKAAFVMYFLGLFNLMFNWGHHIYTLPTQSYVKYLGYGVSMTEWIFLIRIFYNWSSTLSEAKKHFHHFPYRFCMAAEFWVLVNLTQALFMSIPAINVYTHGTHVTVAHAMGTTIGINTMILLASCFEFLIPEEQKEKLKGRFYSRTFWFLQISLFVFWLSLLLAGIQKAIWQMGTQETSYTKMMEILRPYFVLFTLAGLGLLISLGLMVRVLLKSERDKLTNESPHIN